MFPTVMNALSVGVFSCERIAAHFPPLWRKRSPSSTRQRKVRLSEGRPILVTFHLSLVLVGATNIFLELIHPLLKSPNCVLKQQLQILQLSEALGSAFSLFERQEQALSAYCHFHPLIFDFPENTTLYTETTYAQDCFRYFLAKSITGCVKFTKRAELWIDFWQFNDIFEPPGQNELIIWKTDSRFFFSRLTCPTYSGMWASRACS